MSSSSSSADPAGYVSLGEVDDDVVMMAGLRPPGEPWQRGVVRNSHGAFVGFLVYDVTGRKFDAHCGCRSHRGLPKCHIHRVISKRPLGYLIAWLIAGREEQSRGEHFAMRLERGDDDPVGFAARVQARALAKSQSSLAMFFELEAVYQPQRGDGEEPSTLR